MKGERRKEEDERWKVEDGRWKVEDGRRGIGGTTKYTQIMVSWYVTVLQ